MLKMKPREKKKSKKKLPKSKSLLKKWALEAK